MNYENLLKNLIEFPNPNKANKEGLLAVGGDLSPNMLISAYAQGIFPWFTEGSQILWWSPDPRLILYPKKFKVSSSLKQKINKKDYAVTFDCKFDEVIENCATVTRPEQDGTWLTPEMKKAYIQLHNMGIAHSVEVYNTNNKLVGGLYGVSLGKAFFGESMFYLERDASKIALFYLVKKLLYHEFDFIDAQQSTKHLLSLGAEKVARSAFMMMLQNTLKNESIIGNWGILKNKSEMCLNKSDLL